MQAESGVLPRRFGGEGVRNAGHMGHHIKISDLENSEAIRKRLKRQV